MSSKYYAQDSDVMATTGSTSNTMVHNNVHSFLHSGPSTTSSMHHGQHHPHQRVKHHQQQHYQTNFHNQQTHHQQQQGKYGGNHHVPSSSAYHSMAVPTNMPQPTHSKMNYGSKSIDLGTSRLVPFSSSSSMLCGGTNSHMDETSQDVFGPVIDNEEVEDIPIVRPRRPWKFNEEFLMKGTPSMLHGMTQHEEMECRRKGTTFIRDLAKLLEIKTICKETAYVMFHRFFALRSFKKYDTRNIAMACLYLACKYDDHLLRKENLIQVSHLLVNNHNSVNKQQNGGNGVAKLKKTDQKYLEYSERLITDENTLLQVLGFELEVKHFSALIVERYTITGANKELYTAAFQVASEINRLTTLCLQYDAPILASVAIYLAGCYKSIQLPGDWCDSFLSISKNKEMDRKLILKISEHYREILASSQLINKMLSDEYKIKYNKNRGVKNPNNQKLDNQNKQQPNPFHQPSPLLLNNFSPDSAYSSSSSTAAAYSPTEQCLTQQNKTKINNNNPPFHHQELQPNNKKRSLDVQDDHNQMMKKSRSFNMMPTNQQGYNQMFYGNQHQRGEALQPPLGQEYYQSQQPRHHNQQSVAGGNVSNVVSSLFKH